ncbi:hypothetical protein [Sphingomonas sp. S6]|jgi:hypothetical protein|uniref:hypothetical protein n=1 Tax=Sphingomonas sp. S6 TaxID=3368600 RepID=UPI000FA8047A|nr:hypothetical protein [uncultured Sphingomonas sp.]RTL17442.1 MAG: hypothetical protein EKK50_09340 [Sphingomonadaceae bacterium]
MRYEIVHSGGVQSFEADTVEAAITEFDYRGYAFHRINANRYQRAELQGQSMFATLIGPMWGGDRHGMTMRYETQQAYNHLSIEA